MSFGNDGSSNVIGSGTVTLGSKDDLAKNVLFVENMNQNLLSVGKMCDQGHTILFNSTKCEIRKGVYGEIVATASQAPNDIYVLDEATKACLIVKEDDTIIGSNDDRLSKKFSTKMQSDFDMSLLSELTYFLGLQISQQEKGIFICQAKYIKEMLKKFKMEDCKPVLTPMVTGCKLSIDDSSKDVDQRLYRSMISSLLYVTASRPNVMQAIGQVARFQAAPKESHIISIKIIIRYLKGTT